MNKEVASEVMARFRYIVLEYSRGRNISKVCREFNIPRSIFYHWRKRYEEEGLSGLLSTTTRNGHHVASCKNLTLNHPCWK